MTKDITGESQKCLEKFLNSAVTVTVKDGRKFRGKLVEYDDYMNILLEDAEEVGKGAPKHKLMLIKGGNVGEVSL